MESDSDISFASLKGRRKSNLRKKLDVSAQVETSEVIEGPESEVCDCHKFALVVLNFLFADI